MNGPPDPARPGGPGPETVTVLEDDVVVAAGRPVGGSAPDGPVVVEEDPVVLREGPDEPEPADGGRPPVDAEPPVAATESATESGAGSETGSGSETGDRDATGALIGPAVDPRMKRRWIDQRRHEGRRRLRILIGLVAFACVASLAWVVAHSSLLGASTITVRGTERLDPAAVRAAAGIEPGTPLLFLDDASAAARIERLPAVASAKVRTELPDTVVIDVVERRPIAWARAAGADPVALIDSQGLVFARVATQPDRLMQLAGVTAGPVGSRVPHADALQRVGRLPQRLRLMTDHTGLTDTGAAVLVLVDGNFGARSVILGDGRATARKGAVALAVLDDLQARGEHREVVDVSVPDAPVVR